MIADGTPFRFGARVFEFGDGVAELKDSSPLLGDTEALRRRLAADGYLFVRGFHDVEAVREARAWTLGAIAERGGIEPGSAAEEGIASAAQRNFPFFRVTSVAHAPPVLNVVDSEATFSFFRRLFGKPAITFDKRWLRCMARGGQNHFHYDNVYVGRGTPNRLTLWSPLTDIALDEGPLVICLGSHRHVRLRQTYGMTDMDRDLTEAVFSSDPKELVDDFGFTLGTAHFRPGDALLFGMFMMHSSAPNLSGRYRISIDTRYQPADEAKDERFFFGDNGRWLGNFYNEGARYTPMAELRQRWGL
jgi:hypothetical protein